MIPWSAVAPASFSIEPGEKAELTVKLKIPKGIYGDFRGSIMVAQDAAKMDKDLQKKIDLDNILMGKSDGHGRPQEVLRTIKQYVRVAIPVYVRVQQKSALKRKFAPQLKLGKLKIGTANEGEGTLKTTLFVENRGYFDLRVGGTCRILHGTKKSLLRITDLSDKKITVMPRSKQLIAFTFSDPLPAGNYIMSVNLKAENRGFDNPVRKSMQTGFNVSPEMAATLSKMAGDDAGSNIPQVPLLVDPGSINLNPERTKIKPFKLSVVNPTNKTLGVRSIFRSASKNKKSKPSVTITPSKFDIEPGKSKRIRVQIKPGGKEPVYGNLLFGVKGMKSSRPVQVPVMIVPQGLKLKRIATISELEATTINDDKSVRILGLLKNTGDVHLGTISVEISIRDFLDNPVKEIRGSVGRKTLLPAEKTRVYGNLLLADLKDNTYKATFSVKSNGVKVISNSFRFKVDSESDEVVRMVE